MSDDPKKKKQDATRVSTQDHEIDYWTKKFGCTKEELKDAVKAVGDSAAAVEKHLSK